MAGRLSSTAWVGLGLILSGIAWFGGSAWWANTRIWQPVDVPISLSVGHVRTPEFKINVESTGGERWRAYDAEGLAFVALLLSLPVGISVLIRAGIARRAEKQDAFLRTWCLSERGPQLPIPGIGRPLSGNVELRHCRESRPWNAWPFSRTSWYGLVGTHACLVILIPVWVMISGMPLVPKGLVIDLAKPGIVAQSISGIQPLRVRVEAAKGDVRPKLYVGSRLVAWEDFGAVLQKELSQRPPNWPVYVEGSRNMEWGHAVRAIDTIRGLQAQVVLLTPSTASGR